MAKRTSKGPQLFGRLVKGLVGALLIPPVVGISLGLYEQLSTVRAGREHAGQWFLWGLAGYAGMHLLLYRPMVLFRVNHALLERLAVWLFGGQVATVGSEAPAPRAKPKRGKDDGADDTPPAEASTLVVFSPYLVPLYVVLLCVIAWALTKWTDVERITWLTSLLIGIGLSFHLSMAGEDLQEHAEQFPIETRLMALAISALTSVTIAIVCLPLALPAFSIPAAFARAGDATAAIYSYAAHALFF